MFAIAITIVGSSYFNRMPRAGLGALIMIELFMLIEGTVKQFFPIGITIAIFVIGLTIVGLWLGRQLGTVQQT